MTLDNDNDEDYVVNYDESGFVGNAYDMMYQNDDPAVGNDTDISISSEDPTSIPEGDSKTTSEGGLEVS